MRHALLMKTTFLVVLSLAIAAPVWAQWTTPTIDGSIGTGEYGTNNQLNNAGNTGQTWYMTWDASNLYVGIVNANVSEGASCYIVESQIRRVHNADGNLTGFNYDGASFSSLPFRATFVTYAKNGYREYRNSDGSGGWASSTSGYGSYADDNGKADTREVAIPWSAITGGGIPSSFVFFGYLVSERRLHLRSGSERQQYRRTSSGTNATATQYFAVVNTGNGTSTPPFSLEQPGGIQRGRQSRLLPRHLRSLLSRSGRRSSGEHPGHPALPYAAFQRHLGCNVRAYMFDTASGMTTGPVDTGHAVRPEHHHQRHGIRHLEDDAHHAVFHDAFITTSS